MRHRLSSTGLALFALFVFFGAASLSAQPATPVLKMPGSADKALAPAALLGRNQRDVRLEDAAGNTVVYHGLSLLEVLEANGLDVRSMAGQRKAAGEIVLASGRDGYTVVFSLGELLGNRSNPRVFTVAESSSGPLPENEGPIRLIVYGDKARSAYGLAKIELKVLAENTPVR